MKSYFVAPLVLLSASLSWAGPRIVGNGGDLCSIEFLGIAQQVSSELSQTSLKIDLDAKKLVKVVDEATIECTSQPLEINKAKKDAINYPQLNRIVVNRLSWAAHSSLTRKATLVLHEYLGLMGVDDSKYTVSTKLITQIGYGKVDFNGRVFDRKLTTDEINKLLPQYLEFIESKASEVASPLDNETLRRVKVAATNRPKYVFKRGQDGAIEIIGSAASGIESLKKSIARGLDELNQITPAQRAASTTELAQGFRSKSGRLTCEVGYLGLSRMNQERIVRCMDDRSRKPKQGTDDEGYVDQRIFILGVEHKTLAPVGVVTLETFEAG